MPLLTIYVACLNVSPHQNHFNFTFFQYNEYNTIYLIQVHLAFKNKIIISKNHPLQIGSLLGRPYPRHCVKASTLLSLTFNAVQINEQLVNNLTNNKEENIQLYYLKL